jgi:hypothetical protein
MRLRVENRRTEHVAQRARPGVRVDHFREIRTLLPACRFVVDHEAGRRQRQGKRRARHIAGEPHPSLQCAIDDDMIVTERCHGAGSIHEQAQLGVRGIDAIRCSPRVRRSRGR